MTCEQFYPNFHKFNMLYSIISKNHRSPLEFEECLVEQHEFEAYT